MPEMNVFFSRDQYVTSVVTSVADPKLLFSDLDPTWRVITDPDLDPIWRVFLDPDQTLQVVSDSDPAIFFDIFLLFFQMFSKVFGLGMYHIKHVHLRPKI